MSLETPAATNETHDVIYMIPFSAVDFVFPSLWDKLLFYPTLPSLYLNLF